MTLALSKAQRAALELIAASALTAKQIGKAIGISNARSVLMPLNQAGAIAYVGGPGVGRERGTWRITDAGRRRLEAKP